jgi:threonine dehydrogenase-like Zn-dependent dehydrogenase
MAWTEKTVIGSQWTTSLEFAAGIRLAESGNLCLKPLVSHVLPIEDIHRGFELLTRRDHVVIKVAIVPQ